MVVIHVERTIAAAPVQVFDWLADPMNLTSAPMLYRAGYTADSPLPGVGAVRGAIGIGIWVREEITAYDRPDSYSYLIVRSVPLFDHRGGTLSFQPSGLGTHVVWESDYSHPARWGGRFTEAITAPLLRWNFNAILAACARATEG